MIWKSSLMNYAARPFATNRYFMTVVDDGFGFGDISLQLVIGSLSDCHNKLISFSINSMTGHILLFV